jgi:hypothetical protein
MHATCGALQTSPQTPAEHVFSIGQSTSLQHCRQVPPQSRAPGGHWQRPIMQRSPGLQTTSHAPQ